MLKKGKLAEAVLKRSVLRLIHTDHEEIIEGPSVGSDCAVLLLRGDGRAAVSSDPVAGPAEVVGRAAVVAALNNLAAAGAEPEGVTLSLLLPEGTEEEELRQIISDADSACEEAGIGILGGHTEVTDAVTRPVLTATAIGGFGLSAEQKNLEAETGAGKESGTGTGSGEEKGYREKKEATAGLKNAAQPGDDLVVTKWIGLEATWILAREKHDELRSRFSGSFLRTAARFSQCASVAADADIARSFGATAMRDLSSGGIFGALWEFSERGGTGLDIDLRAIPIRQETVEICECFDIDPYRSLSSGSMLIASDDGYALVRRLKERGINAAVIGKATAGRDRILRNGDEIRYLDKPQADQILKIHL
jgi:hydrogenase maturation factor